MNRKHFLRILSAALLPALLSACAAQRPELYAMRNGGSHQPFYFTDRYGELAFREFYDWAGQFVGDRAVVERDGKWGYIDRSGETVVPFRYDWAGSFGQYGFDEEVAMVKTETDRDRIPLYTPCPTALIDRDGERITPVYGFMTPIVGGVSFVNDGRKFHGVGRDLLASDGNGAVSIVGVGWSSPASTSWPIPCSIVSPSCVKMENGAYWIDAAG